MNIENFLQQKAAETVAALYGPADPAAIQIQKTRKEFEGDYTLVVFPLLKLSRKKPEDTATEIGEALVKNVPEIKGYNVIKGFLNLSQRWLLIPTMGKHNPPGVPSWSNIHPPTPTNHCT